jgi:Tol biopolymer transport system component
MNRATCERRSLRRAVSILAMFGLVAGLLAATAGSASGTYRGKNGRIAFATDPGDGRPQVIKTMKRDGTDVRRIVSHAVDPNWAPDGSAIVFERDHTSGPTDCSIQISNRDGSGIVDLTGARTGCEQDPTFTPQGRRIVFVRNQRAIYRMNLTGGGRTLVRRVPTRLVLDGGDPNVSPGGGKIAFVGTRSDGLRALYTIKSDGTQLDRITRFRLEAGSRIDWSPSGRRIVFTEYRAGGPGNTATIRPDGSGLVQITHYSGDQGAGGAVYSPDGRWILYRHQNDVTGRYAIWKMRHGGSHKTRIRNMRVYVVTLDWGPQP